MQLCTREQTIATEAGLGILTQRGLLACTSTAWAAPQSLRGNRTSKPANIATVVMTMTENPLEVPIVKGRKVKVLSYKGKGLFLYSTVFG